MRIQRRNGSNGWNFKSCHKGVENSLEQIQVEKVRRVRTHSRYRINSCIVQVGKVRRVGISRIYNP